MNKILKKQKTNYMHRKHLAKKVWGDSQRKSSELIFPIGAQGDTGNQFLQKQVLKLSLNKIVVYVIRCIHYSMFTHSKIN